MRMRKENKGKSRKSWLLGLLLGAGLWMLSPQTAEAEEISVTIVLVEYTEEGEEGDRCEVATKFDATFDEATGSATCSTTEPVGYPSRNISVCSSMSGANLVNENGKIEFADVVLTNDELIRGMDRNYELMLRVELEPEQAETNSLRVFWKIYQRDEYGLATVVSDEDQPGVFEVVLPGVPKTYVDESGKAWLAEEWRMKEAVWSCETSTGEGPVTVRLDGVNLEPIEEPNIYAAHFYVDWKESSNEPLDGVISGPGTYNLVAGTKYTLSFGPCTVNGDGCTYSSGITFYVPSDGAYTFANAS